MTSPAVSIDLSIFSLFLRADTVVQIIMLGLVLASLLCWAIIFDKVSLLKRTNKSIGNFENVFWSGLTLDEILKTSEALPDNPMSVMFASAMHEYKQKGHDSAMMSTRIERAMNVSLQKEGDYIDSNMSALASIGSAAPFIGLLGTVWGIMNSFSAIASTGQTSLSVVAPGIAEALFATALGLFAAIPATIAYNKLSSDIDRMYVRLEAFTGDFVGIISR